MRQRDAQLFELHDQNRIMKDKVENLTKKLKKAVSYLDHYKKKDRESKISQSACSES